MSTVNQIYALVNEVAKQTFGESAITVKDTSSLVALGDKVLSSDKDTDKFAKSLVDRIGRTIFSIRRYNASGDDGLVKEPFEYGCIVQKIYVDLPEAKENNEATIKAIENMANTMKEIVESSTSNTTKTLETFKEAFDKKITMSLNDNVNKNNDKGSDESESEEK